MAQYPIVTFPYILFFVRLRERIKLLMIKKIFLINWYEIWTSRNDIKISSYILKLTKKPLILIKQAILAKPNNNNNLSVYIYKIKVLGLINRNKN